MRISLTALLVAGFFAVVIAQDSTNTVYPITKAPIILAISPTSGAANVDLGSVIKITFNSEMDGKSINGITLQLHASYADTMHKDSSAILLIDQITDQPIIMKGSEKSWQQKTDPIGGTISYSNKVAVFTPDSALKEGTLYTFTITNGVKNLENIALTNDYSWSFTTIGASE